jgi:hypothetical protein
MINNVVILKTFKSRQDIEKADKVYKLKDKKAESHIDETIFCDSDIKKVFNNAINKNKFTWQQVKDENNYIMYMCSNSQYDYFKSKLTKTSYRVER